MEPTNNLSGYLCYYTGTKKDIYTKIVMLHIVINDVSRVKACGVLNKFYFRFSHRCAYDYLEVRDGSSRSSPVLQTLCGPTIPSPIKSSRNSIYLRFRTDQDTALRGFNITYKTGL